MGSREVRKPHAICVPYPAQGHINPMLKLAKVLHSRGFCITFVHSEFNSQRLLRSRGPDSLKGLDDFRFETIPDGLSSPDCDATQDIPSLCISTRKNCLAPFRNLLTKINHNANLPRISCIVADGSMAFTLQAAHDLHIPHAMFWTTSACGFMCYLHFREIIRRGLTPLKDDSYLTNGYLDTRVDWIPGMNNIRFRDLPSFVRTTDPYHIMLNFAADEAPKAYQSSALILNTFDSLEHDVLEAIRSKIPQTFTVGPLSMLCDQISDGPLKSIGPNLWKEDRSCLEWLGRKSPKSVVYVNFGSITVMTAQQMEEFAWGLAKSNHPFLWIIRPDLVEGDSAMLPPEFLAVTKDRGMLASWCPQEQVVAHPSIGVFLTHCGWNSTLDSICSGVPVICWPFFAEQQTNCRYACADWGVGLEIDDVVKRDEVEGLVRDMMEGDKGKEMRKKAMEWKEIAEIATKQGGSSLMNIDKLVNQILICSPN